jgi:hypothetical protein
MAAAAAGYESPVQVILLDYCSKLIVVSVVSTTE